MKKALLLASAGLAGLTNAAVHTLKLQKISLSDQLVRLSFSKGYPTIFAQLYGYSYIPENLPPFFGHDYLYAATR